MNGSLAHGPTRAGSAFGVLAGVIAAMSAMAYSSLAAVFAVGGLILLLSGILLPRPGLISVAAASLVTAIIVAGLSGAPAVMVLPGTIAAVLAWDLSHNAASHGRHVGQTARTMRAEGVHALGSLLAGAIAGGAAYGIFLVAEGGQPATAVALLALASVLLVFAIRST